MRLFARRIKIVFGTICGVLPFANALCQSEKGMAKTQKSSVYQSSMVKLYSAINPAFYNDSIGYYNERAKPEANENNNKASYLWPLCGLIQAYNEVGQVQGPKGLAGGLFSSAIGKYYDTRPPAPGYASYPPAFGGGDRFYDDNQWIGIALMDAYAAEKVPMYLDKAKEIYRFMMTAYDTAAGGGLYWQEGKLTSKNTCSNGPGVILALQLYKATKEKPYLDTALLLYNWTIKHLQDADGLYFDNIGIPNDKVDKRKYSYNTGTMMQSGIYLYELTGKKQYLAQAIKTANASVPFFCGTGKFIDGFWFNAVLFRAYQHLLKVNKDTKYISAFKACVDDALQNETREDGLMLANGKPVDLTNQAGMLEILARLVEIDKGFKLP